MFLASFTDISCKIIFNQYPADYYWGTDSSLRGMSMEYGFFVNVFLDLSSNLYGDILIILCKREPQGMEGIYKRVNNFYKCVPRCLHQALRIFRVKSYSISTLQIITGGRTVLYGKCQWSIDFCKCVSRSF